MERAKWIKALEISPRTIHELITRMNRKKEMPIKEDDVVNRVLRDQFALHTMCGIIPALRNKETDEAPEQFLREYLRQAYLAADIALEVRLEEPDNE